MNKKSNKRHLAKTITWRIVGTTDTILISWLITGNAFIGLKIGLTEIITKMALYFLHERVWSKIKFSDKENSKESRKRHLTKTFTWRGIGTLDTIIISWIISGNPFTGLKIGITEIITKMILYYIHERVWSKVKYGFKENT